MASVSVNLPHTSYDIIIESDVLSRIDEVFPAHCSREKIIVFADQNLPSSYAEKMKVLGQNVILERFDSGEEAKTIETVTDLYTKAIEHQIERNHPMIALGGGVAGDVVGFTAASYLRGVPFIQVPTSLLAMVDASVGGKTGYNHPLGKNLIGAFKQPELVLIDLDVLETLPEREFKCGLAECIKHGLLGDWALFEWTESNIEGVLNKSPGVLEELIARNVQVKARIVEEDEKEKGVRALLNFGHTFAHAIEVTSGYGVIKHGEAVALGCVAACHLAAKHGLCENDLSDRARALIKNAGLPVVAELAGTDALMQAMSRDKKVQAGTLRLILPTDYGKADIFNDIEVDAIVDAWDAIRQ